MTPGPRAPSLLLVKPAGADCNFRCDYCFYLDAEARRGVPRRRMSDEVLERMIASYLALELPVHAFCWQGGEPTLMGVDFFRRVTELQERHGRPGTVVANSLQTNAALIDDAFADHLADYRFLVGCSLDGPPRLHDRRRRGAGGGATHDRTLAGLRRLQARGVAVNALCVVHDVNAGHPREVFDHLVGLGFDHLQFLPCVEFGPGGAPRPWTITGRQWGEFLSGIFEAWRDGGLAVSVRNLDAVLQRLVDDAPGDCTMDDSCRQYLVVEHDGGYYPCDFAVAPDRRLGNVMTMTPAEAMATTGMAEFGRGKAPTSPACGDCRHFDVCRGGCPARRDPREATAREWLCEGTLAFLDHARGGLQELADAIRGPHHAPPPFHGSPGSKKCSPCPSRAPIADAG